MKELATNHLTKENKEGGDNTVKTQLNTLEMT